MQPHLTLVTTSMVVRDRARAAYVADAITSPLCVAAAVFAACVGLGAAGLAGMLASVFAVIVFGAYTTRFAPIRRHLERAAGDRAHARIETRRWKALRPAGPPRQAQFGELRTLVEDVERTAAHEATQFELQALLDQFVQLAIDHQRCLDAIRIATSDLPTEVAPAPSMLSMRRREIVARRLQHRETAVLRAHCLADELGTIDELIRLIAQRAACPILETEVDREVSATICRQLWELDELDAAYAQISA